MFEHVSEVERHSLTKSSKDGVHTTDAELGCLLLKIPRDDTVGLDTTARNSSAWKFLLRRRKLRLCCVARRHGGIFLDHSSSSIQLRA
jgi:hypothetical protein